MGMRSVGIAAWMVASVACDSPSPAVDAMPGAVDAPLVDGAGPDANDIDAAPDEPCQPLAYVRYTAGGQTTIEPPAIVDTGAAWIVAYVAQTRDVWWTTVDYRGQITTAPARIAAGSAPSIAINGDRVMVAYRDGAASWTQPLTPAGALAGGVIALVPPATGDVLVGVVAGPGVGFRVVWAQPLPIAPPAAASQRLSIYAINRDGAMASPTTTSTVAGSETGGLLGYADGSLVVATHIPVAIGSCSGCTTDGAVEISATGVSTDRGPLPHEPDLAAVESTFAVAGERRYLAWRTYSPTGLPAPSGQVARASFEPLLMHAQADMLAMAGTGDGVGVLAYRDLSAAGVNWLQRFEDDGQFRLGERCSLTLVPSRLVQGDTDNVLFVAQDVAVVVAPPDVSLTR